MFTQKPSILGAQDPSALSGVLFKAPRYLFLEPVKQELLVAMLSNFPRINGTKKV